jgi:hypothetical protein
MRFAAAALAAISAIGALSASAAAGAATTGWNAKANAGSLDITLLGDKLELGGGITEADANSGNTAEAMGTGLCVTSGANACPTDVTSPGGQQLSETATAIQNGANGSKSAGPTCLGAVPSNPLLNVGIGCGNASASESNGSPTAEGDGSILGASAINVTLGSALGNVTSNAPCAGSSTPAASSTPGGGSSTVTGAAGTLLGAVDSITSTLKLPALDPTSVDQSTAQSSSCSILGGLVNELGALPGLQSLLGGLTNGNSVANTSLLSVAAVASKSTIGTSTVNGDPVETASAEGDGLDVNVLSGMLEVKVIPAVATATVDTTTGHTTSNCTPGLISVAVSGQPPNIVSLQALGDAINQILDQLEASALKPLLDALLQVPDPGILSCDAPTGSDTSTSVTGGIANLFVIPGVGPGGLVGIKVNDVTASASSTSTAAPATQPAQTPGATPAANPVAPAAAPATVANVTSVHTGEFWSGSLPIILLAGMGLAGGLLIGRRRILSVARSINPLTRRRGAS